MVGVGIGRGKVVDIYGDTVVAAQARGDGFRRRHDQVKMKIVSLHKWAGVDVPVFRSHTATRFGED